MDNSVVIKGSKNGITVKLDDNLGFDELKDRIRTKFAASAKFFEKANLALSLEGRNLTDNEEQEILDIISEESDINIVCLMEHNKDKDEVYARAIAKVAGDGILPDVPYENKLEVFISEGTFCKTIDYCDCGSHCNGFCSFMACACRYGYRSLYVDESDDFLTTGYFAWKLAGAV